MQRESWVTKSTNVLTSEFSGLNERHIRLFKFMPDGEKTRRLTGRKNCQQDANISVATDKQDEAVKTLLLNRLLELHHVVAKRKERLKREGVL